MPEIPEVEEEDIDIYHFKSETAPKNTVYQI